MAATLPASRRASKAEARLKPKAKPGPASRKSRKVWPARRGLIDRGRDIAGLAWKASGKFNQDNIPIVSAGVTFFTLLAVFPGIGAFVALYGLLAYVDQARQHLRTLAVVLPPDVVKLIGDE